MAIATPVLDAIHGKAEKYMSETAVVEDLVQEISIRIW
jgi:hypothetical protein